MIDIYSRFVVRVADHAHESGSPAAEMMKECFGIHGTVAIRGGALPGVSVRRKPV